MIEFALGQMEIEPDHAWWLREVAREDPYVAIADRNAPMESPCRRERYQCPSGVQACINEGMCISEYEQWLTRPHIWEGDNS